MGFKGHGLGFFWETNRIGIQVQEDVGLLRASNVAWCSGRRKAGSSGSSPFTQPGGSYYESYRRGPRRQSATSGGAGSDNSDVDDFEFQWS